MGMLLLVGGDEWWPREEDECEEVEGSDARCNSWLEHGVKRL